MSKNFDLLQNLGKEDLLSSTPENDQKAVTAQGSLPAQVQAASAEPASVEPGLEEVAALAQQIFVTSGSDAPRSVVFTSTETGTGCTWVSAHLGPILAGRVAGSVCLVDANFHEPGLHQRFGIENINGISDALVKLDPIRTFARSLIPPNLWLIPSGSAARGGQALLASDRMRLRIGELRSEFDFVLIDTPAMVLGNEAVRLGSISDGVVLVLQANASRRNVARQAIRDMQGGGVKVLGAVLNRRTFPIPDAIYKIL